MFANQDGEELCKKFIIVVGFVCFFAFY